MAKRPIQSSSKMPVCLSACKRRLCLNNFDWRLLVKECKTNISLDVLMFQWLVLVWELCLGCWSLCKPAHPWCYMRHYSGWFAHAQYCSRSLSALKWEVLHSWIGLSHWTLLCPSRCCSLLPPDGAALKWFRNKKNPLRSPIQLFAEPNLD